MSQLEQILTLIGAISLAIGPLGSTIEAIGEATKSPKLIALGQRLEAIGADVPKLLRGSRKTAADNAPKGTP